MKNKIFVIFWISILLSVFFVSGAQKELSASVQVIDMETPLNNENPYGELGSLKGSVEKDLFSSSEQNQFQKIIYDSTHMELLSVKVEHIPLVFIFSIFTMFLFVSYILFFILKIKHHTKNRVFKKKRDSYVF